MEELKKSSKESMEELKRSNKEILDAVTPLKHQVESLNELKEEISSVKAKPASGEQPVFDSVDALFDKVEAD